MQNTEMRRSQSAKAWQQPKKQAAQGIQKSFSIPLNMHSTIADRRWLYDTSMQSHCVIKNSRVGTSEMHVLMTAKNGQLHIYFEQLQAGICRKFRLVDLRIDELVLMHSMRDANSFYIATPWKGRLDVAIYCTPVEQSVNSWCLALQRMGACKKENYFAMLQTVCELGQDA
jgi:hypothetical protein